MQWIGIDFGTTNSAAARKTAVGFEVTVRQTQDGELPLPSLVSWFQQRWDFGDAAHSAANDRTGASLIIRGLKHHLGRVERLRVDRETFDVEEIAGRYLRYLLDRLFEGRQRPAHIGAVLGTPVVFPPAHRQALRQAAQAAGIQKVEFVYEPTAALIGMLREGVEPPVGPVAVVDWGGGTVDVTIVRYHPSPERVEDLNANAREQDLGGGDLDRAILELTLDGSPEARAWFDSNRSRALEARLLNNVERAKITHLMAKPLGDRADIWVHEVPEALRAGFRVSPEVIDSTLDDFCSRIIRQAARTAADAGLAAEDVDAYLLVGGPFASPLVRKRFRGVWPRAREIGAGNRQLATAKGCAALAESGFRLQLATDVAVRQHDGQLHLVLRAGQELPVRADQVLHREYAYHVTDLAAGQAVFELGHRTRQGHFVPLETVSVPLVHALDRDLRRAIPSEARLRIGLDSDLYVQVTAVGTVRRDDDAPLRPVEERVRLSRIPFALVPGTSGARP